MRPRIARRRAPSSPSTAPLPFYQDPNAKLVFAITPPAEGLPTTVIYDRTGKERARVAGGADWSGPDAHKLIDALLAEK